MTNIKLAPDWRSLARSSPPLCAGGCTFKDQLLQPQQPQLIFPRTRGVAGAEALYIGALGRLQSWSVGGGGNQETCGRCFDS